MTTPTPRPGKPQKPADDLAERVDGMKRFSVEMPLPLLRDVDSEATRSDRGRQGEIRVLLGEAIQARRTARKEAKKKDAASP